MATQTTSKTSTTVRLAGFGGQGIVKAGEILGNAAVADGKRALQNQAYGSSARGGLCTADVIVSGEEIYEIEPDRFDVLVALNQQSFDAFVSHVTPKTGVVVFEADLVKLPEQGPLPDGVRALGVRATHLAAQELGRKVVTNMVALGYFAAVTGLLSKEALETTVTAHVPRGTEDLNLRAFRLGWDQGQGEH